MRMTITEKDIERFVQGKFIIRLSPDQEDLDISTGSKDAAFLMEKRIKFVSVWYDGSSTSKVLVSGFYYANNTGISKEEFVKKFNGEEDDSDFYRLLTQRELDWLCEQMKKLCY